MAASNWMSHAQFEGVHRDLLANKGFTVNPHTGAPIESGISVAPYGNESRAPVAETTPESIARYADDPRNRHRFVRGAALGGWISEDDAYLDTPTVHGSEQEARSAMVRNRQQAGFDLSTFDEVPNVYDPESRRKLSLPQHEMADVAHRNPGYAMQQPEVQAWIKSTRRPYFFPSEEQ